MLKAWNVNNFVNVLKDYITKFLHKSNLFLIFDWCHDYIIKCVTYQESVGNAHLLHNVSLSSPVPSKEVSLHLTETRKQLIELLAKGLLWVSTYAPCFEEPCNRISKRMSCVNGPWN